MLPLLLTHTASPPLTAAELAAAAALLKATAALLKAAAAAAPGLGHAACRPEAPAALPAACEEQQGLRATAYALH